MNRRQFTKLAIGASIFANPLVIGYAPYMESVLTTPSRGYRDSARNAFTCPAAIEPITGFLARSSLLDTPPMPASFEAVYYLINWGGIAQKTGFPHNYIAGRLRIRRQPANDHVIYNVYEERSRGSEHPIYNLTARYWCTTKLEHLFRWALTFNPLDSLGNEIAIAGYSEKGVISYSQKSLLKRMSSAGTVIEEYDHPIIHQASLLYLLAHKSNAGIAEFCMAHEGMTIKRDQSLHNEGIRNIYAEGTICPLLCYRQTGIGVSPIHYLVDPDLRIVQLITKEEVNYALWNCSALS